MTDTTLAEEKPKSSRLSLIIAILLAVVLLFFAFRNIAWGEFFATLSRGHPGTIATACLILSGSLFLRGIRWGVLLSAERRIGAGMMFWATSVGYLGNALLPARAGEVMRSMAIGRYAKMSKSYVFATAITERILDAVTLVLISLFALATLEGIPDWLNTASQVMGVLGVISIAGLFVAPRLEGFFRKILYMLPIPDGWKERLAQVMEGFLLGMKAFQHGGRAAMFAVLTVVIWLADAIIAMQVAQALDLSLTLAQSLLLLAALGLSSAAPSTPGYVGIYQFVAVSVLPPFGFTESEALAYIVLFQAVSYVTILFWGFIGLWRVRVTTHTPEVLP
jgi:uncharacterized protein (TIRG00374 family)